MKAIIERLGLLEGEATLDEVPNTGNAPFVISHEDLSEVAPLWAKLMQDTIGDREAVIGLGMLKAQTGIRRVCSYLSNSG